MGNKKQNKKVLPSKSNEPNTSNSPTKEEFDECKRANRIFHNGDHIKALKAIDQACRSNKNSGLLHRVHADICARAASENKDTRVKKKLFTKAMDLAEKAVLFSPNSIEFAEFYTRLLFHNSHYQRVVQEGERALAIQNPIDPAIEDWTEQNPELQTSSETRIAALQHSLHNLVNQCVNVQGNESEKPIAGDGDEILQDFKNLSLLAEETREGNSEMVPEDQNGESKEIKKTDQTPEERRRKEIEERVAAARLAKAIEENSKSFQGEFVRPQSQLDRIAALEAEKMKVQVQMMATKLAQETRQHSDSRLGNLLTPQPKVNKDGKGKSPKHVVKKEEVQLLWNSMTLPEKQKLFKLNIHDLLAHFESSNTYLAKEVLTDALSFAIKHHSNWKFWMCWSCGKKFEDYMWYFEHIRDDHIGPLSEAQAFASPASIGRDWNDKICNVRWEPLSASAARPIPEAHSKQLSMDDNSSQTSSLSEENDRSLLLERIRQMLENLLRAGYLAASHVDKIKQYTTQSLQGLYPGSILSGLGLSNTHLSICLLGASQLQVILTFLKELSEFASEKIHVEKNSTNKFHEYINARFDIGERIELNGELLCVVVEEQSLQGTSGASTTSGDALLKWIYSGPLAKDQLELWQHLKIFRERRGAEYHQILQKYYNTLKNLCDQKCEWIGRGKAITAIWGLLLKELKERRSNTEYVPRSFESILQKLQEKLELERKVYAFITKTTLKVLSTILKQAGAINFTNEQTLTEIWAINVCGLEIFEDVDLSVQNSLDQADISIKETTKLVGRNIEIELMKHDSWIMATYMEIDRLGNRICDSAAADYREVLLPFAKSYIREKLEGRLDKEAKEEKIAQVSPAIKKSDNEGINQPKPQSKNGHFDKEETDSSKVAKEAKLAPVSPEIKKSVNEGSSQSKAQSKNSKNKMTKKSKNRTDSKQNRFKDSKRSGGNAQFFLDQQSGEQIPDHTGSSSADHPDSESICKSGVGGDNDLKQEEEKVRYQMEMETIALKLQEKLEFQRQYEHDCKQKRLEEIRKEEEEKVRHQKEMEALQVQEKREFQRQYEHDYKQKRLAEIHNEVTEKNPNKLVGGMETMENVQADTPSTTTTTQQGSSSGGRLDRTSNTFVNMGGNSITRFQDFSIEAAAQFLADRWEAVMRAYNDPTIDESERPVMYSGDNESEPEASDPEPHDQP